MKLSKASLLASVFWFGVTGAALAQTSPPAGDAAPAPAPAAPPADAATAPAPAAAPAAAAPMPMAMSMPAMTPPLSANPNPTSLDAGPLGKIYVTGALTGLAYTQNHVVPGDHKSQADLSNAQVFIQKTDGLIQFYVQAGIYSMPAVGTPYLKATTTTENTYSIIPQAYIKIAPTAEFNVMAGKLPTLIGAEYNFTFENPNIMRGLLWAQEPGVSRGVQANYTKGPLAISVSWNDGYYSDRYTWGSALVTYTANANNSIAFAAAHDFKHTSKSTFITPLLQNNGEVYNIIFTHTGGPLTLIPYVQYTHVPSIPAYGIAHSASTTGAAILGKYSFTPEFSFGGRVEYIHSSAGGGDTNLLYGPGSHAWSFTITPTFQVKALFLRAELSYVTAGNVTTGSAFGPSGSDKSQTRGVVETGVLF